MTQTELADAAKAMHQLLDQRRQPEECAVGWTESKCLDMQRYFQNLERDLQSNRVIPFFSLVRALDGMGISEGALFEEMCRINNEVNALARIQK